MARRNDAITVARSTGQGQQSVSVSTSSAASGNEIGAGECLVLSDVACFALAGSAPTATVAAGTPIPANVYIRLEGLDPSDKLAFITATGTGTVYIRPGA